MIPLDLLNWPDIHDAQLRVAACEEARATAARKYQIAPHGERGKRLRALQEASTEALKAGLELARLRKAADE